MDERELAENLLRSLFITAGALVDLQLRNMPDAVRTRIFDAVRNATGRVELRTRIDTAETELVLVPIDGSEPPMARQDRPSRTGPARCALVARHSMDVSGGTCRRIIRRGWWIGGGDPVRAKRNPHFSVINPAPHQFVLRPRLCRRQSVADSS
jgi:hypothetical protein